MYQAAIIGISGFGDVHYRDLVNEVNDGHARIIGATVINQEQEAEKCAWLKAQGAKLYTDWQQMLKELKGQLDLCFIPTGIYLHTPMTLAALQAGANVMVEKPVTATIQEVEQMAEASRAADKFIAVGYQNIYLPETMRLKELLLSGKLGQIKDLKALALWPRDNVYYNRNNWAGRLRCNGQWVLDSPFNNALAHFLNLLCFYAGDEAEKSAELDWIEAELYRANPIESCDTAAMRVHCRNGRNIFFCVTHACAETVNPAITIIAEKATVQWNNEHTVVEYQDGTREQWKNATHAEYRAFLTAALRRRLDDPAAFYCNLQIAGTQTIAANGAHESSGVHDIPAEYLSTVKDGESVKTTVRDIRATMENAVASSRLFSETGAPWGQPGKRFSLRDYRQFNGGMAK